MATPWVTTAKNCLGLKEYPGAPSNPAILNWAKRVGRYLGAKYDDDHIPWCGLFTAFCMVENNIIPPSVAVRASAWGTWGQALTVPHFGAVLVFTREGGGHVGFFVGHDETTYHVLGGNQGDKVCVTRILKSRCAAIRWPAGLPLPTGPAPAYSVFNGAVSTNER